jgi:hypothetical protein
MEVNKERSKEEWRMIPRIFRKKGNSKYSEYVWLDKRVANGARTRWGRGKICVLKSLISRVRLSRTK